MDNDKRVSKNDKSGKGKRGKKRNYHNRNNDSRANNSRSRDNGVSDTRGSSSRDRQYGLNDISWYTKNPNLILAAGSIPYPYRPGSIIPMGQVQSSVSSGTTAPTQYKVQYNVPGVLAIEWGPTIGSSDTAMSPVGVAAKEIYARVRQVYSGALDVEAADFMIYLMALDSIFSLIAHMKRIYRIVNAYTPDNYVLPDGLLCALGIQDTTLSELRQNKTQLWQNINELVLKTRKFKCPASMNIFNRHYWMNDNVYADAPSIASQLYVFKPAYFYQFAEVQNDDGTSNTAGGLIPVTIDLVFAAEPVETMTQVCNNMIDALVAWDDAYTINGYLMRAYDGEASFVVEEEPIAQPFTPVYVEEVLTQIENCNVIIPGYSTKFAINKTDQINPTRTSNYLLDVTVRQNPATNTIVSRPRLYAPTSPSLFDQIHASDLEPIVSIRSDSPTVADTVIATRLKAALLANNVDTAVGKFYLGYDIVAGTEIPLSMTMWNVRGNTISGVSVGTVLANDTASTAMYALESYDWHPIIRFIQTNSSGGYSFHVIGDVHNITSMNVAVLENLHKVCVLSEFNAYSI